MSLDTLLRDAIRDQRLVGINLWPSVGGGWQANTTRDRVGWRIAIADDPVEALTEVLLPLPGSAPAAPAPTSNGVFD